jgi:hypothetical protein
MLQTCSSVRSRLAAVAKASTAADVQLLRLNLHVGCARLFYIFSGVNVHKTDKMSGCHAQRTALLRQDCNGIPNMLSELHNTMAV